VSSPKHHCISSIKKLFHMFVLSHSLAFWKFRDLETQPSSWCNPQLQGFQKHGYKHEPRFSRSTQCPSFIRHIPGNTFIFYFYKSQRSTYLTSRMQSRNLTLSRTPHECKRVSGYPLSSPPTSSSPSALPPPSLSSLRSPSSLSSST
jgi:hypothetical protein